MMFKPLRFRTFSATILALCAAAVARPLAAQEIKLGFIHAEKVVQAYSGYKDAEAQFEKQREIWNQEIEAKSRELKAMEEDFRAQEPMLTDERRRERMQGLEQRRREFEQYYQQIFGSSGEAVRKQEELLSPIYEKVNAIIRQMGEQEKFTMIFDSSTFGIAYAAEGVDLTEKVIERLNASD
jgi:outer membrane protein